MEQIVGYLIVRDLANDLAAATDPRAPARPERPRRRWWRRRARSGPVGAEPARPDEPCGTGTDPLRAERSASAAS